jgi:hypothetical protein
MLLTTSLFDLIAQRSWNQVLHRLSSIDPQFITYYHNEEGMNIFHATCSDANTPPDIITCIANLCPLALSSKSKSGSLPLHYACESGSIETVDILLKLIWMYCPTYQSIHSHIGCLDVNERSPLDRAWLNFLWSTDEDQMSPSSALLCDTFDNNHDNLGLSAKKEKKNTPEKSNISKKVQILKNITSHESMAALSTELMDLWYKTELILFWGFSNQNDMFIIDSNGNTKWSIIHAIAASGGCNCWCPSIVMFVALKLYGYQTRLQSKNGNLPLHIAVSNPIHKIMYIPSDYTTQDKSFGLSSSSSSQQHFDDVNGKVLDLLLHYYPQGTQVFNHEGFLPLHLALKSSKDWESVVAPLLRAYPNSLDVVDQQHGLYPYMLAACCDNSRMTSTNDGKDIRNDASNDSCYISTTSTTSKY